MRLQYPKIDLDIELVEDKMLNLSIENVELFSEFVENLTNQCLGVDGELILMDDAKELSFQKNLIFVSNPFLLDCNEKKIINELYKQLRTLAYENYYDRISKVNSEIIRVLDELISLSQYNLTFDLEGDIVDVFKNYNLRIAVSENSLMDRIIDFIKSQKQVCHINAFVFLNIKHFLTKDQISELYKICFYEKVHIVSLEGMQTYLQEDEQGYIIDSDLCIINLNE